MRTLLSLAIVCLSFSQFATGITTTTKTLISPTTAVTNGQPSLAFVCEKIRGGASSDSSKKARKKKKSKGGATKVKAKKAIDDAMKEKDTAEALGDAIR